VVRSVETVVAFSRSAWIVRISRQAPSHREVEICSGSAGWRASSSRRPSCARSWTSSRSKSCDDWADERARCKESFQAPIISARASCRCLMSRS
jgi:hypothetical protein